MDVLLDTNIYLTDVSLSKPEHEALKNYLTRSNSRMLLSSVVKSEVLKNFNKRIDTELRTINGLSSKKLGLLTDLPTKESLTLALTTNFDTFSTGSIAIDASQLDLSKLIERSLSEKAPFKTEGKGFRDALIWYSLIKHLQSQESTQVAFITNNTQDFGSVELKTELVEELEGLGLNGRIHYFNSLDEFNAAYGSQIEFINEEFIDNALNEVIQSYGESVTERDLNIEFPNTDTEWEVIDLGVETAQVTNYYIYRSDEEFYYVYADVYYVFYIILNGIKWDWDFNYLSNDYGWVQKEAMDTARSQTSKAFELKVNKNTHQVEVLKS